MRARRALVVMAAAGAGLAVAAAAPPARAELLAAYVSGFGGFSSPHTDTATPPSTSLTPALGLELGARLLALDAYVNYTSFGGGMAVERGILGLRGGIEIKKTRLYLRIGAGGMAEQGGALTGPVLGTDAHVGVVARAGVGLERRLAKLLLAGIAVDGEAFALGVSNSVEPSGWTTGKDIFASLHLTFEIGL